MLNAQIPSGLQALMQASQILQKESAPTAPGPQGPQPTVASQVQQALAQQAQPTMQTVGQQAGIAGQLMAQRQQQQQQMAQNPQAVAQMAAQMLQQKGVAGLPVDMQFKEGGIIGFDGEDRSDVPDPEAGLSMAEREIRRMREKGPLYSPYYGMSPEEREAAIREDEAAAARAPESAQEARDVIMRAAQQARERKQQIPARPDVLERLSEAAKGVATTVPAAIQAPFRKPAEPMIPASASGIDRGLLNMAERGAPAGGDQLTPALRTKPPVETPAVVSPTGIATVAPQAAQAAQAAPTFPVQAPDFSAIRAGQVEDPEAKRLREAAVAAGERSLKARTGQEDLESQGIAALKQSETERQRLLESRRSRDAFNSLIALARDLRTRGDQYTAYQTAVEAREEADRSAMLAHEEAVLKLRQAKQAREIGNVELAQKLANEAYTLYKDSRKTLDDAAKAEAIFKKDIYTAQMDYSGKEMVAKEAAAARREATAAREEASLRNNYRSLQERRGSQLAAAEAALDKSKPPLIAVLEGKPKLTPDEQQTLNTYKEARQKRIDKILEQTDSAIADIEKKLNIPSTTSSTGAGGLLSAIEKELRSRGK